ncbi:hypothetical protein BC939DRAFT_451564 [Gamsiella multidivaricata]|uniref:uncharacterized protein n=1 Tax=Gamsiella multidivaricata TaxID=101098 RepID=UPI00222103FB|nr:uncharacterized protein BC939DRAFT_451564 [Gamsiella multidivaricata]KAI7823640.1 hypothetical protein BC939DRAFT_451564 [Gamsiella multidivaricata]
MLLSWLLSLSWRSLSLILFLLKGFLWALFLFGIVGAVWAEAAEIEGTPVGEEAGTGAGAGAGADIAGGSVEAMVVVSGMGDYRITGLFE